MDDAACEFLEGLKVCFSGLEDPRVVGRCDHLLLDIVAIAILAESTPQVRMVLLENLSRARVYFPETKQVIESVARDDLENSCGPSDTVVLASTRACWSVTADLQIWETCFEMSQHAIKDNRARVPTSTKLKSSH